MVLFRVRGVPVKIGWSWLIIVALILWSLASVVFPSSYPGLSGATHLGMAVVATGLFVASILFHELSHTLQSLREGVAVRDVTLWLFGGVSRAEEQLPGPAAEFRVVAAGPLASAVLAVLFWVVAVAVKAAGLGPLWWGIPQWLAWVNALLLGFNLVPALPLDGGRLLHALLWWRNGESTTATIMSAVAGRAFAGVLMLIGAVSFFSGNAVTGFWFVLLGWFLLSAVQQEVTAARLQQALAGLRVRDLMATRVMTVQPEMTIAQVADLVTRTPSHPVYPVMEGDRVGGLMLLRRAGEVPIAHRAEVRVCDVMVPAADVPTVHPEELVAQTMSRLTQPPGRAVVLDEVDGRLQGVLSVSDLSRVLETEPLRRGTRPRTRRGRGIAALAAVIVVAAAALLYHPPLVVIGPGPSFDIAGDISVSGARVEPLDGEYLLTSVSVSQPSAVGVLVAALRTDREVVALGDVVPAGMSPADSLRWQRDLFLESQQNAAVAAARAAGYRASVTGSGAEVVAVVPSSPAASALRPDDVVVAVDGLRVQTATDFRASVEGRPAGQQMRLTVERGDRRLRVTLANARLPQVLGGTGLGVLADTRDLEAVLPFEVSFRPRPDVGGPSAGLAYALALTDMLDPGSDASGRTVAATGTISPDGAVGAVGGVHEKALAARGAGADVLLVPSRELGAVVTPGLDTVGVPSLERAVDVLQGSRR